MKKYIFMFILGSSSVVTYSNILYKDFALPAPDLFDERRIKYETHVFNNIPALSVALGAGFLTNIISKPGTKNNRIMNGVVLTALFGIHALELIGIVLNNTVYYQGSLSTSDYLTLRYDAPLNMWRFCCYCLGYMAACGLHDLEEEPVPLNPEE